MYSAAHTEVTEASVNLTQSVMFRADNPSQLPVKYDSETLVMVPQPSKLTNFSEYRDAEENKYLRAVQ